MNVQIVVLYGKFVHSTRSWEHVVCVGRSAGRRARAANN